MRNTFLILSLLMSIHAYCQGDSIFPENKSTQIFNRSLGDRLEKLELEDLRKDQENSIRIWTRNTILTFGKTASLTLHASKGDKVISQTYHLDNKYNFDSLEQKISISQILEYANIRRGIDEFPLRIEIVRAGEYQLFSSYGNKALEDFIADFDKTYELNKYRDRFIDDLPLGNYRMGMGMVSVGRPIKDSEEKSEFYKEVMRAAENELQIDQRTPVREFPLVLINGEPANLKSLNALDLAKVENYKILPGMGTATAIYGSRAANGVILVTTK